MSEWTTALQLAVQTARLLIEWQCITNTSGSQLMGRDPKEGSRTIYTGLKDGLKPQLISWFHSIWSLIEWSDVCEEILHFEIKCKKQDNCQLFGSENDYLGNSLWWYVGGSQSHEWRTTDWYKDEPKAPVHVKQFSIGTVRLTSVWYTTNFASSLVF